MIGSLQQKLFAPEPNKWLALQPGLDGWDAKELAILPLGVFALFRTLALEWGNQTCVAHCME